MQVLVEGCGYSSYKAYLLMFPGPSHLSRAPVNHFWRIKPVLSQFSSVQFSRSVVSDSLRPHESQHTRPPCPSSTPGVHSDSCPSSQWCHPAISSSVVPFSSCPNPSQHQSLFQWVNSLHEVAKVLSQLNLNHHGRNKKVFLGKALTLKSAWSGLVYNSVPFSSKKLIHLSGSQFLICKLK